MAERITGGFEGGGVKGIALAGAAAAALDRGYEFDQTVGTSAGAMVASLVSAGFGPGELRQAVTEIDWPGLTAKSALRKNVSMIFRLGFHIQTRSRPSPASRVKGSPEFWRPTRRLPHGGRH